MNRSFRLGESVFEALAKDGERVLCRAPRGVDGAGASVLLLVPTSEHPDRGVLDRLAHEFGLRDSLDSDWAIRPLEMARERGRVMLVLEDPGGEPLERLLGAPMDLARFLGLAIGIAQAVGKLHRRGLVHKDVKPANIMVGCTDARVRLTGFGLASRLARATGAGPAGGHRRLASPSTNS